MKYVKNWGMFPESENAVNVLHCNMFGLCVFIYSNFDII